MLTEAKIQRVGGSTFARLSPDVVKKLGLRPGDSVQLNIVKDGLTLNDLVARVKAEGPLWVADDWKEALGPSSKYD